MNKIKYVSMFCRFFFMIIFIALPLVTICAWMIAPIPLVFLAGVVQMTVIPHAYASEILHTLSMNERMLALAAEVVPLSITLFIFYCLIKLFGLYEAGEIFTIKHVRYIRNIGYALFAGQLVSLVHEGVLGIILTLNNPHGHRLIRISFSQVDAGMLMTALMSFNVLDHGRRLPLHEEQQLTI